MTQFDSGTMMLIIFQVFDTDYYVWKGSQRSGFRGQRSGGVTMTSLFGITTVVVAALTTWPGESLVFDLLNFHVKHTKSNRTVIGRSFVSFM